MTVNLLENNISLMLNLLDKDPNNYEEVYHNQFGYRIIVPLTKEAFEIFEKDSKIIFDTEVLKKQSKNVTPYNIYIISNNKELLFFHFKSKQYFDMFNKKFDISNFFDQNKDIYNFFNNHITVDKYLRPDTIFDKLIQKVSRIRNPFLYTKKLLEIKIDKETNKAIIHFEHLENWIESSHQNNFELIEKEITRFKLLFTNNIYNILHDTLDKKFKIRKEEYNDMVRNLEPMKLEMYTELFSKISNIDKYEQISGIEEEVNMFDNLLVKNEKMLSNVLTSKINIIRNRLNLN